MIKSLALAAVAALSLAIAAPAAKADSLTLQFGITGGSTTIGAGWHEDRGPRLEGPRWGTFDDLRSPRRIVRGLFRRGFDDVEILRLRGSNYIVRATSPRGDRVRLVVDGYTGEIVGFRRASSRSADGFDRAPRVIEERVW